VPSNKVERVPVENPRKLAVRREAFLHIVRKKAAAKGVLELDYLVSILLGKSRISPKALASQMNAFRQSNPKPKLKRSGKALPPNCVL
jgi:hypothetical protein